MNITLVPRSGLCNRLIAIASGLAYKEMHPDTVLRILWVKWYQCNCRFKDLFKQLPSSYPQVEELTTQFRDLPGHRINLFIPDKIRHFWYDGVMLMNNKPEEFETITKGKKNIYISRHNLICQEEIKHNLGNVFIPTDEIQSRIDSITKDWEKQYVVGVHIRRTDNAKSIKNSPDEYFYNVIEKEMAFNKDVKFYLATDDNAVKKHFKERYGDKIITIELCLKRTSVQGMKDAVVDLFCLGKTRKIYGSDWSTYSKFASWLFDIEVIR